MLELIKRHFLTQNELGYKKMSKFITLGAMGAEKLQKQKWKQFCGTPCISDFDIHCNDIPSSLDKYKYLSHKVCLTICATSVVYIAHSSLYAFDKWKRRLRFKMATLFNSPATLNQNMYFMRPTKHLTIRTITRLELWNGIKHYFTGI